LKEQHRCELGDTNVDSKLFLVQKRSNVLVQHNDIRDTIVNERESLLLIWYVPSMYVLESLLV